MSDIRCHEIHSYQTCTQTHTQTHTELTEWSQLCTSFTVQPSTSSFVYFLGITLCKEIEEQIEKGRRC